MKQSVVWPSIPQTNRLGKDLIKKTNWPLETRFVLFGCLCRLSNNGTSSETWRYIAWVVVERTLLIKPTLFGCWVPRRSLCTLLSSPGDLQSFLSTPQRSVSFHFVFSLAFCSTLSVYFPPDLLECGVSALSRGRRGKEDTEPPVPTFRPIFSL